MLLLASISTWAQFGIKLGFGQSSMRGDKEFERNLDAPIWVPLFGASYHWNPSPELGIYPEILLSQKGSQGKIERGNGYGTAEFSMSAWFLDIPLLVAATPISNVTFLAGPTASVFLSGAVHGDAFEGLLMEEGIDFENVYTVAGTKELDRKKMDTFSWGVVGGIQYMIPPIHIGLDLRYTRGLTSIEKDKGDRYSHDMTTDLWALSAVYLF